MIRIGIRVSRIFIKSYFIISFTEEIQGYFHITGLTIVDRSNVPIVPMLRATATYSLTEASGTTVLSQVVGTVCKNSNPGWLRKLPEYRRSFPNNSPIRHTSLAYGSEY